MGRADLESEGLDGFRHAVRELGIAADRVHSGMSLGNRFDCGFKLCGTRQFQFGDLRVCLPDRIAIIELESAGGVTNLVKYWPLALQAGPPILLLHVFRQASDEDYVAHLLLWDFAWSRIRNDLSRCGELRLFTRRYVYRKDGAESLAPAIEAWRTILGQPINVVLAELFQTHSACSHQ